MALALSGCVTGPADKTDGLVTPVKTPKNGGSAAVASTIIAAMGGGLLGGTIGDALNASEKRKGLVAEYRALEYTAAGQPVSWQGEEGRSGEVIAAQPYRVGSQDCRQYSHALTTNGQKQTVRGTACRNSDGSWTPLT